MRTILVDSQLLKAIQACPAKVLFQFEMSIAVPKKPPSLLKGELLHEIMAGYYLSMKEGNQFKTNVEAAIHRGKLYAAQPAFDISLSDAELIINACQEYFSFREYERIEVLDVEVPFTIVIYESEEDDLRIVYSGKIDLLAATPRTPMEVWDHKSQAQRRDFSSRDDQFKGYCYATKQHFLSVNVIGLQKTVKAEDKFRRPMLSYTTDQLEAWRLKVIYWVKQYLIYKDNAIWPENETSCDKYTGCPYQPICDSVTPEAKAWKIQTDYIKVEPWDPTKVLGE